MSPLENEAREFNRLKSWLASEYNLDEGDEAVQDTAEGASTLTELLERMVRAAREREAQAKVCKAQTEALAARKKRHETVAEEIRAQVAAVMLECGIKKLKPGDFTASARMTGAKAEIFNEEELPPFYTKTKRVPDKEAINSEFDRCQAEKASFDIPGCSISNGRPSLTIRT